MTAADVLTAMGVLDNELDVSSGGADETRALDALDMAQDAFESVIAGIPELLGTVGSNITTTANTEATSWPSTLLRLDSLWLLDTSQSPNLPRWQIDEIQDVGGHREAGLWPVAVVNGTGAPKGYWTNRTNIYWRPLPDTTHTVRVYGLFSKTDFSSRSITFGWPDQVSVPMASVAVELMAIGIGDPSEDVKAVADRYYRSVIRMLQMPSQQRPKSRYYSRVHTT